MEQMIATTLLNKGVLDPAVKALRGQTFATGDTPPKIVPFDQMNARQYADFLRWTRLNGHIGDLLDRANSALNLRDEVRQNLQLPDNVKTGEGA